MDWFQKLCSVLPAPDCVVHIGAGLGADLAAYENLSDTRVVLVEPQPRLAAELRRNTARVPGIDVLECAVGEDQGHALLHVFNLPALSSLRQPTGLQLLMPGLMQAAQIEVEIRTLDEIVASLGLESDGEHWLVIDAPGAEAIMVDAIADSAESPVFRQVFLRAGAESLYEDGRSMAQLLETLEAGGYSSLAAMSGEDPDWPSAHLFFDEQKVRNRELNTSLDALKARSTELEQLLEQQRKEFEDKVSGLGAELRSAADLAERKISELAAALSDKDAELANQAGSAKETEAQLQSELSALKKAQEKLRSELGSARSDLAVSVRVQALREADLRELQERFAKVNKLKDQQNDLLIKLGQRLGAASQYLKQLKDSAGKAEDHGAAEGLVRALAGDFEANS